MDGGLTRPSLSREKIERLRPPLVFRTPVRISLGTNVSSFIPVPFDRLARLPCSCLGREGFESQAETQMVPLRSFTVALGLSILWTWRAIRSSTGAKDGGMDETRTRDLLRDRQTL
jgi:hypothetical protein